MTWRVPPGCPLTQRQYDCITLVAGGLSYRKVGEVLGIQKATVSSHMLQACWALGAHNMRDGIAAFVRGGWHEQQPVAGGYRDHSHERPAA